MKAEIGRYDLEAATGFGPRITGLALEGGPEIFARLGPDRVLSLEGGGAYRFRGGHRLWAAPEVPEVSYAPDDHECAVTRRGKTVTVTAPVDGAGLVKEISVSVSAGDHRLVVEHRLTRVGEAIEVAPWAISQFPLGGTAIVPVRGAESGSQANRSLVFWPYTNLDDDRIDRRGDVVLIDAMDGPQLKLGTGPAPGRLGYLRLGMLFIKTVPPALGEGYPDRGAVGQVYVGQGFCELESVGPLATLDDGDSITHRETWEVLECADLDTARALTAEGGAR